MKVFPILVSDDLIEPPFDRPPDYYLDVTLFQMEGFEKNPPDGTRGDVNAKTATGMGALFAVAVVPTGTTVQAFGSVAADQGGIGDFDVTATVIVPEPGVATALALLALIGGRRNRVDGLRQ
jgi:hypothetical protein